MGRYSAVAPHLLCMRGTSPTRVLVLPAEPHPRGRSRVRGAPGDGACVGTAAEQSCGGGRGGRAQPRIRLLFLAHFLRKSSAGAPARPGSLPASEVA